MCTVQLFNLFKQIERTDAEGATRIQAPYQWRRGGNSIEVDLVSCPMPGQLVTRVLPKLHQQAHDKILPRGQDFLFVGLHERHGIIDNCAMLVPLRPF